MQTLIAFAYESDAPRGQVEAGRERVEQWYGPLWGRTPRHDAAYGARRGVLLWSDPDDPCRWPAWATGPGRVVASLHVPLGFERLVGSRPPAEAALALADRLRERPEDVSELTPPFVLATYEQASQTLALQTDGLGLGRLFSLRTPSGTVWSNRPVAALTFAGLRAEPDALAWRRMAGCDWAMGSRTPYAGVHAVPAGTRVEVDDGGTRTRSLDVLRGLVDTQQPLTPASVDAVTAALIASVRSVASVWPGVPTLSLSGGRDSRLVAASFLAAGLPVRLKTFGAAAGEAETARRLVALLPTPVEHEVTVPIASAPGPRRRGALARARRWHDVTEGLRPALYLRGHAPRSLPQHRPPLVCGVGGEFGHAPGYPHDVRRIERLASRPRQTGFVRALQAKIVLPSGPSASAEDAVVKQIERVLEHAAVRGVTDAKALDWFYADERLRRWGMTGESAGRVMPLLVPEFVRAGFGLSTAQGEDSALHVALIARLVPAWADVPYYSATLRERTAIQQQRLWEETDADLLGEVFADPRDWGDGFDVDRVQAMWRRAREGRPAARDELLLQRVIWRAGFTDHLAALNGEPAAVRRAARSTRKPAEPLRPPSLVHRLAVHANDVPVARRLARTRLGRRLRRALGV